MIAMIGETVVQLPQAWVVGLAPLIPVLTALAVRREGSNQTRAVVAIAAAALLAVVSAASSAEGVTVATLVGSLLTTLVVEFVAYNLLQGVLGETDLNDLAGDFGIDGEMIDE